MVFGYNARKTEEKIVEDYTFDRYLYPEFYDCYNIDEISDSVRPYIYNDDVVQDIPTSENVVNIKESPKILDGPMDSPWPMYCHDTHHTGRSHYSTRDNNGFEKWKFATVEPAQGDAVIDDDGIIYIGSTALYGIYPNGTMKWKYDTIFHIESAPAIDENGVIYFGTNYGDPVYMYAVYPNGTLKWKQNADGNVFSSPAIGNDGTIYYSAGGGYPPSGHITALYPNGTLRWSYKTNHVVYSSPAIGNDGTVYCGCHDTYLYALYPNNGTLKWRYKTDHWMRVSPCVADDGTIYVVSLDNHLHAVNPDGTLKWKTNVGAGTSPTIGQNGTIYAGYSKLHAINPTDGSVKWTFNAGGDICGGTPCNSVDGTIYFGTHIGDTGNGKLIAVNPDGTEKWRRGIGAVESAPAIAEDGTVYIGSNAGYLYAFGKGDINHSPDKPSITGPTSGAAGTEYEYIFVTTDLDGDDVSYFIEWGDGTSSDWLGSYSSGEEITASHTWSEQVMYTIRAKAKDIFDAESSWATLSVSMPKNKVLTNSLFLRFLERFPILQKLLLIIN